jgi:hypothetical protein
LDMGKPVRIAELARHMAQLAPVPIRIEYSALRPGEKLHEELFGAGEVDRRPLHPLISHVEVPPLHPAHVRRLDAYAGADVLSGRLAELCRAGGSPDEPDTLLLPRHEQAVRARPFRTELSRRS